jgi:uncharacterized protein YkwD
VLGQIWHILFQCPKQVNKTKSLSAWFTRALALSALAGCTRAAPSPAPAGEGGVAEPISSAMTPAAAESIVSRTNAERARLRLPALDRSAALMRAAQLHAGQMAAFNRMAHDIPDAAYPSMTSRLEAVGYRWRASAENVAVGHPTTEAVVAGWMASPGHRENIVSTQFTEMGAGVAVARNGRLYHAQVFGRPR